MSYMKRYLEDLVQNEIDNRMDMIRLLARMTKYTCYELVNIWSDMVMNHFTNEEELDWDGFVTVTLEQDW